MKIFSKRILGFRLLDIYFQGNWILFRQVFETVQSCIGAVWRMVDLFAVDICCGYLGHVWRRMIVGRMALHGSWVSLGLAALNLINWILIFSRKILKLAAMPMRAFILFTHVPSLTLICFSAGLFLLSFLGLEDTMSVEVLVVLIDSIEGLIINMRVHLGVTFLIVNGCLLLNDVETSL